MNKWPIRAYRSGDEQELIALFQRVFGISISEAHWRWKLKPDTVSETAENVWLAVDGDRIIFQYAGIPTRFRLLDEEHVGILSVDTMASPDYRRQGLLTHVGRFVYDKWREAGVAFVIGLPNEQWGTRATALGWEKLFPLQWLSRPLRPEALLARRLRIPFLARFSIFSRLWRRFRRMSGDDSLQIRSVTAAGPEFDVLWQTMAADNLISAVRDARWVNWRYLTPPSYDYEVLLAERDGQPVGYIAYRLVEDKGRRVGFIAELTAPGSDVGAANALINQATDHLLAAGAETAVTLAVPQTHLHATWRQAGFLPRRAAFNVQIVPLADNLPMEALREPKNWHMVGGDFDVI